MTLTLLFKLGQDTYGLEIDAIQEIVEDPTQHFVPKATGVLTGAINFHGNILAVVDLPALLDVAEARRDNRRLVLTPAFRSLVLTISDIERIIKLDLSIMRPPPEDWSGHAIRGMVTYEDREIRLLDTAEIIHKLEDLYAE